MVDCSNVKVDVAATKHILLEHQRCVIVAADEEDFQRIAVRRSDLFKDAFRAYSKPNFNVNKVLKVRFMSDPWMMVVLAVNSLVSSR